MAIGLAAARADLVDLLKPVVNNGGEVSPYTPDAVNVFPAIWLGEARGKVTTAMSFRTWTFELPITFAVANRKAILAEERAAATANLDAVVDRLEADYSLGGNTFGIEIFSFAEGEIGPIGGETLVGFTLWIRIKMKPEFAG
jgi:hypothetical protein